MANSPKSDKDYWFKRRRYGWGWVPVKWQGWLVLLGFIGIVFAAALRLPLKPAQPTAGRLARYFGIFFVTLFIFLIISSRHGPPPRWRWGKKDSDNANEDF
jgi:hypothetical protein